MLGLKSSGGTLVPQLGVLFICLHVRKNGMFAKSKSVSEDWRLQPLQRSSVTQPAAMLQPSETISSISPETTIVGRIICEGVLKIYGLVEGEVIASNALIADGARIRGDIVACRGLRKRR
jgi:hypothetical protein